MTVSIDFISLAISQSITCRIIYLGVNPRSGFAEQNFRDIINRIQNFSELHDIAHALLGRFGTEEPALSVPDSTKSCLA